MTKRKNSKSSNSSNINELETQSDITVGTQKLQDKASRTTGNIFSRMLTKSTSSSSSPATSSKTPSSSSSATSSKTPIQKKSSEDVMNVEDYSSSPAPPAPTHKKSTESMVIDDDNNSSPVEGPFKLLPLDKSSPPAEGLPLDNPSPVEDFLKLPLPPTFDNNGRLTTKDFNYTMKLIDDKINSLYKLCRYISDQQNEMKMSLNKLVALDELTDNFWNGAYKEVSKQLLPTVLFPSTKEYREALEKYLKEHASHFINSIGRNSWISLFEEKLLPELKAKCRSRRNDIAANIRNAMFAVFGEERLEHVDSTTSPGKLAEWKTSEKTRKAYNDLFSNHDLLSKIGHNVFKSYKERELPTMHCAYILSICDILLNSKSSGIKCSDKSVVRRVNAFLRAYESNKPVTESIMNEIAEAEEKEIEAAKKKQGGSSRRRTSSSQDVESEDPDRDYDDIVNDLDNHFYNNQ